MKRQPLYIIYTLIMSIPFHAMADPNLYDLEDLAAFVEVYCQDCSSGNDWCNGFDYDISGTVDTEDFGRFSQLWLTSKENQISDDIAAWILNSGAIVSDWNYQNGFVLLSLYEKWLSHPNPEYLEFIKNWADSLVNSSGTISGYKMSDYNLDEIRAGSTLLVLYEHFGDTKYKLAMDTLIDQLENQPTTFDGGFWHKQRYDYQMWLDGVFMAEPFACGYAKMFGDTNWYDEAGFQCTLIATHTQHSQIYGSGTGLCYHGWDSSAWETPPEVPRVWADPIYGHSPEFWGRAQGWYAMALVDCLDIMPADHPDRPQMIAVLGNLAAALETYQDPATGLWWQIVDKGYPRETYPENYTETSCSAMFSYALGRAVEQGYLPADPYLVVSRAAFEGIVEHKLTYVGGYIYLIDTVQVGSLSGDGDYDYYMSVPRITNDLKGIGAFMRAALQYEKQD